MMTRPATVSVIMLLTLGSILAPTMSQAPSGLDHKAFAAPPGPSHGRAYHEDAKFLTLENGFISLKFNRTANGGIESVFDPANYVEFRSGGGQPPLLFQLVLTEMADGKQTVLSNLDATAFSYYGCDGCVHPGTSDLVMNLTSVGGLEINVSAQVELRNNDPRSYWGISVQNDNSSLALAEVRYPVVLGIAKDIGNNGLTDMLAVPKYDGIVYTDPYKKTQAPYKADLRFRYPGTLSMQFMALYDPEASGLYLEAQDTVGNVKEFFMEASGAPGNVMVGIAHMRPYTAAMDADIPYNSVMAVLHGDWYQAAELYKGWSLDQYWTKNGPMAQRVDVPSWWLDPAPVVSIERSDISGADKVLVTQWSGVVASYKALTGTNITLQVLGWEQNGSYTGPYYLPPKDGDTAVKDGVKAVLVAGGHVMFSTSEDLWRLKVTQSGYDGTAQFDTNGLPWAVMNMSGDPALDPGADRLGMPAAVMDPTTNTWQHMDRSITTGIASDIVDIQELQDLPYGAWIPCYNPTHGHPMGLSEQITQGHLTILSQDLAAGQAVNPDFMLTTEGPSELFLDKVQAYRSSEDAPERGPYLDDMNAFGGDVQTEPMFATVYHEYTSTYGTPVPIGGLDMPAFYNSSARSLAKAFVLGKLPSVSSPGTSTGNPKLSELLTSEAKTMSTNGRDYLWYGEMLEPPVVQSPDAYVPYRVDPRPGQEAAGWAVEKGPQVLSSAWRSSDGSKVAVTLVNWGNTSADVNLMMPSFGLPDVVYTLIMTRNGERSTLAASTRLPHPLGVTLAARDVVLIEAVRGPDPTIEDIKADPASLVVGGIVNLTVSVANRGSVAVGNVHVLMMANGSFFDDAFLGQLGPNVNATLPFVWSSAGKPVGTYNMTAMIWPIDGELSVTNNHLSTAIKVLPVPKGDIRCTLVDNSTKARLAGAHVILFIPSNGTIVAEAISGNDALFTGVLPGTYGLNATLAGYMPAEDRNIKVQDGKTTYITLAMVPVHVVVTKGNLTGIIRDGTTKVPLANVKVMLFQPNMTYLTAGDGAYLFSDVEAGLYDMGISRADYQGTNMKVTVVAGMTIYLDINLTFIPLPPKVGAIVGMVREAKVLRPIANALVNLSGGDIEPMEMLTDTIGGFAFTDVPLGIYLLNITAPGYYGIDAPVNVSLEGENAVTIDLRPVPEPPPLTVTLKGLVRDTDGRPIPGAAITRLGAAPSVTYSDSAGRYQFTGLHPGVMLVKASVAGYTDVTQSVNATKGGTFWLNFTMKAKETPTTDLDSMGNLLLLGLIALMLVGIIIMVSTGRKGREDGRPARRGARPIKKRYAKRPTVVKVKRLPVRAIAKDEEE